VIVSVRICYTQTKKRGGGRDNVYTDDRYIRISANIANLPAGEYTDASFFVYVLQGQGQPSCVGRPRMQTQAKEGFWQAKDRRATLDASLFGDTHQRDSGAHCVVRLVCIVDANANKTKRSCVKHQLVTNHRRSSWCLGAKRTG
jgi:hypothetical protein